MIYILYFVSTTNIPDSLQYLLIAAPVRLFRELMKQLIRNIKLSFLFLILLYQAGCSPRIAVSGNLPNSDLLESIEIGQVNKQEVLNLLGTPSTISPFSSNNWYYVSERTETSAFFAPKVVDRKVLLIKFNDKSVVSDIKSYGTEAGKAVDIVDRITPTEGRDFGLIKQLLGNLGRFEEKTD